MQKKYGYLQRILPASLEWKRLRRNLRSYGRRCGELVEPLMAQPYASNKAISRLFPLVILCVFSITSCAGLFEKGPAHSSKGFLDYPKVPLKKPAVVAYVNYLASTLASHETPERIGFLKLEVRVLETSRIQGSSDFYSPRIDITRGMLNALTDEAELAALLGHEIGHKVLHKKQTFTARNYDTKDIEYADWSQTREREADEYGVMLAYKAGYDPYALVNYFDRLSQFQKGGILAWLNETTATHKDFRNRARDLKKFLAKAKLEPGQGLKKSSEYSKALASIKSISTGDTVNEIVPGGPNATIARLAEIESELASHKRDGTPLSAERFMEIMEELSGLAKFYGLESSAHFMKEILSQDSPLWDREALARKISDTLLAMSGVGAGFVPMVGDAIDLHEFLTGKDYFTQTKLSFGERVLSAAGILAGSGTGWRKIADGIDKTLDDARLAKKLGRSEIADARHALDEAEDIAPQIKLNKTIIIGEGMETRVKPLARSLGAKWYQAWEISPFDKQLALKRNERWIKDKIKDGYSVVDIGRDEMRKIPSEFYELEKRILRENNYPVIILDSK